MPNNTEEDKSEAAREEGEEVTPKRLRPRWQRWLLWSSVRLLLLAGVGAGVGTVQWRRTRPLDLMACSKRLAFLANATGYYWTPQGELRLYQYQRNGTASLKWDQATQKALFVEMLKPPKGQAFADPNRNIGPHVQTISRQDKQVLTIGAYKKWQVHAPGKPIAKPDYTWKIKAVPNMDALFIETALSPDGKRIAYKCFVPRVDWRDEILRRMRRGYKQPFRGQGAAILVSAVDGSQTKVVGVVKEDMPALPSRFSQSGTISALQAIYWRPDGKHLSFAYGDGVYEVPVK